MNVRRHRTTHKLICWQLTRFCNRRCTFCTSKSSPENKHPERDDQATISKLSQLGVEKLSISGGEPLLYPYISTLLEMASDAHISTVITTNGDYISKATTKKVNWSLPEYVKISFYGNQEIHDETMGRGHFQKLISAINQLQDRGARVGVNVMLTNISIHTIQELLGSLCDIGIDNVLLLSYMMQGKQDIDEKYTFSIEHSPYLKSIFDNWGGIFPNGVKLHNYEIPGFYLLLTDENIVTLPRYDGIPDFVVGDLCSNLARMPNIKGSISMQEAFEIAWDTRFNTSAIVVS